MNINTINISNLNSINRPNVYDFSLSLSTAARTIEVATLLKKTIFFLQTFILIWNMFAMVLICI